MDWSSIPTAVLVMVLGHLPAEDVAGAAAVCRAWLEAARDNMLWKRILRRDYR